MQEKRSTYSNTKSPLPTCQSHHLKMHTKLPTPRDKLSLKPMTSPLRKKSMTIFGSPIYDLEEDEEQTYSNEIGGGGAE